MQVRARSLLRAYGTAIAACALAFGAARLAGPAVGPVYVPPFFAAVFISAWFGGWGPGLLATVLSAALIVSTVLLLYGPVALAGPYEAAYLLGFLIVAALVTGLTSALRAAREQAATRLRQVEQQQHWYELLLDLMPQPLLVVEPGTGRVTFANAAARALADGADAARAAALYDAVARSAAAETTDTSEIELEWPAAAGQRTLAVARRVLPPMHGFPATVVIPFRDITRVKQAEAQLTAINQQLAVATLWAQELAREAEANERRAAFLAEASTVLAGSLDSTATLQQVARLATSTLADFSIVDLVEPDGTIHRVATAVAAPDMQQVATHMRRFPPDPAREQHPVVRALRAGKALLIPEITEETREQIALSPEHRQLIDKVGPRAAIVAPLIARGRTLGAMTFVATRPDRHYGPEDVALAEELAHRAALAVDNARLYQDTQEAMRRTSEALALLDTLLASAPVGLGFLDRDLRFVRVNAWLAAMNGLPVEAHAGRTLREVAPHVADQVEPVCRQVLATEQPALNQDVVGPMPTQPDQQGHWLVSFYPVRVPDHGPAIGVGVVVMDISERRRAEAEQARLRKEAEQLVIERTAILEQMPSGVAVVDARGEIVLTNRAAHRILGAVPHVGMTQKELVAQFTVRAPRHDEILTPEQAPIGRALAGEAVQGQEIVIRRPGEQRDAWLQISAVPLRDAARRIIGAVAVFEDITTRKTLEQLKDEFLSLAAHELKTPLATIKGNAQLLLRRQRHGRLMLSEADADTLRIIDEKADYMGGLINELLDLSRAETGRLALHPEQMDLAALVQRLVLQHQVLHPDTPFQVEGVEQPVFGAWDRGRLEQVFTNLLDNAVKYSSPGSLVRVTLSRHDGEVHVAVQDHGIGIPAAEQPHVFERHFRGSNAGLARTGLGLGLYLSRQIVERHGGRIWVESTEGVGSTFTVALPLASAASSTAA